MTGNDRLDGEQEKTPVLRIALLEREVEDLKSYLYGEYGQPGKLGSIEGKIDILKENIITLNEKFIKMAAALAVLAFGGGGGIGYIIRSLMGG